MKKLILILIAFTIGVNAQVYQLESFRDALGLYFQKQNYYGVKYNYTTDAFTRTGTLKDVAVGTKPTEALLTVQSKMRRCVISDAGVVQYYLDPNNSYLKANGDSAKTDGTDGQVVVEIPLFYDQYSKSGEEFEWNISTQAITGFEPNSLFVDSAGNVLDFYYVGAFPGVLYDSSAAAYLDSSHASIYATGDKLSSVTGRKPSTYETIAEYRAACTKRGTGWHQFNAEALAALQLLFVTEYASFKSQTMVGEGNTKFATWGYTPDIATTGKSLSLGNFSGGTSTTGGNDSDYVSYRGVEDLWGNTYMFIDGANINNDGVSSKLYTADDYRVFASGVTTNYNYIGQLAAAGGYTKKIINSKYGFYPLLTGGSSSTYLTDYYYTEFDTSPSGGWRVVLAGGYAAHGSIAGVFIAYSSYGSSIAGAFIGG
ncbi:MAG: hypothetical protein NUV80_00225, partial [Candidatus Berkelbacteria bacterium]|nr:hypothetical protein [Candidatus Berkelbacteria bacterium]